MTDTLTRVGRIDVADRAERDETLGQLDALLGLCLAHLQHENEFVHAAIEARQPAGSQRTARRSRRARSSDRRAARQEAAALRDASGVDAERLALRLYRHLALFVAENFQHMHIEETANNAPAVAALQRRRAGRAARPAAGEHLAAGAPPGRALDAAGADAGRARRWSSAPRRRRCRRRRCSACSSIVRPHLDGAGWAKLAAAIGIDPEFGRG